MNGSCHRQTFDEQGLINEYAEAATERQPCRIFLVQPDFIFSKKPERPEQDQASANAKKVQGVGTHQ